MVRQGGATAQNRPAKVPMHYALSLIGVIGETLIRVLPVTLAIALVFTVLSHFWALNPGKPWWRKKEIITDALYWFIVPVMARFVRISLMVIGATYLFGIQGDDAI